MTTRSGHRRLGPSLAAAARVAHRVDRHRQRDSGIVATTGGRVRGVDTGHTVFFRGIPYATAPRGRDRFRPPGLPPKWSGVRDASSFGPEAPQLHPEARWPSGLRRADIDEDCLNLNIETPELDGPLRPVMVWIHGGAFTDGSGSRLQFDTTRLVARGDIVAVTLNYRLGALGWLHLAHLDDGYPTSGNNGLLDQIAALRWIGENIQRFGGDPTKITLAGGSAGAMSVAALMTMPDAHGLFHQAILQSGAGHFTRTADDAAAFSDRVLASTNSRSVSDLLELPLPQLLDAQFRASLETALVDTVAGRDDVFVPMGPVIDGVLLEERPIDAFRAGRAHALPMVIGSNRDEWTFFSAHAEPSTEPETRALLRRRFGEKDQADEVAFRRYGAGVARDVQDRGTAAFVLDECQTDHHFRSPAVELARANAQQRPHDTFLYEFTWGPAGALHTIEQPFVFGNLEPWKLGIFLYVVGFRAPRSLADTMMTAWTTFVRSGVPAAPGLPTWVPVSDEVRSMVIDRTSHMQREDLARFPPDRSSPA